MNAAQVLAAGAPTCCNKSGGGASDDSAVTEIVKAAGKLLILAFPTDCVSVIIPDPKRVKVTGSCELIVPLAGVAITEEPEIT